MSDWLSSWVFGLTFMHILLVALGGLEEKVGVYQNKCSYTSYVKIKVVIYCICQQLTSFNKALTQCNMHSL